MGRLATSHCEHTHAYHATFDMQFRHHPGSLAGTPFMDRLATALRFYIHERITYDADWARVRSPPLQPLPLAPLYRCGWPLYSASQLRVALPGLSVPAVQHTACTCTCRVVELSNARVVAAACDLIRFVRAGRG